MSDTDQYVANFCKDCVTTLKKYDDDIRNNLLNADYANFYKYDYKGIGIYSITEPILKFVIFSSLCKKYQIWPEGSPFCKGKKILDLALFSQRVENIDEEITPDIAIEMKWAGFTKKGKFFQWSLDSCVDDLLKLHKECEIANKYFMQLAFCNPLIQWRHDELKEQILSNIDKRRIKGKEIRYIFGDSFDTYGANIEDLQKFNILLWKIE